MLKSAGLVLLISLGAYAQTNTGPVRPISLEESFAWALSNNLSLRIDRLTPLQAQEDLRIARAYYEPSLSFSGQHSHSESGGGFNPSSQIVIPASVSDNNRFDAGLGGNGLYGMTYGVAGSLSATDGQTPDSFARLNDFDSSSANASFNVTQPLLKNFLYNSGVYNIELARNEIKTSEQTVRLSMMTILNSVEQAYYDLIFTRESVKVQQMALELAQRLLAENKKRVEIGTMAPLDEKQAESQVAARQTDLISAYRALSSAQNTLKKLITASYRNLHDEQLEPTIGLVAVPPSLDLQESWNRALTQRPDILQARLDLERQGINLKYYKNQLLPELDISGSFGYLGSGVPGGEFSDALDDLRRADKPNWLAKAAVTIPIGNNAARGRYRRTKLDVDRALLTLKSREEAVLVRVDEDVNQIKASWAQVGSTRAARIYAEEALAAEQKKLEAGKSTSFFVLSLQNDLTAARSAEIRARADYNKFLAQLAFDEGRTLQRSGINVDIK